MVGIGRSFKKRVLLFFWLLVVLLGVSPLSYGEVVHLNPDFSNTKQFIDSLFNDDVRGFGQYRDQVFTQGKDRFFFSTEDEQKILGLFLNVWLNKGDYSKCPDTDCLFLKFLHDYIQKNGLVMFKPVIEFDSTSKGGLPVYRIHGYKKYDVLNAEGAKEFLELLLAGAHFVVIDSSQDSSGVESFSSAFMNDPVIGKLKSKNLGNSHYTNTVNTGGYNYLNITKDTAPDPSSFICSFIEAKTANIKPNTFIQLEGWPASILHHDRHGKDYKTHEATKWNIATFGACAYSEKRATAIFLAKPEWNPQLQADTIMPHYRGADTPQGWLEKDLAVMVVK